MRKGAGWQNRIAMISTEESATAFLCQHNLSVQKVQLPRGRQSTGFLLLL